MSAALLLSIAIVAQSPGAMAPSMSGGIEGRPSIATTSPLQKLIDAAPGGATIEVAPGRYEGDLYIDRTVRLIGQGRPKLIGSGTGSVVRVRAANVLIEGFDIDARAGGRLDLDSSGIHVTAPGVIVRDVRIDRALFGVYLREADDARVERTVVRGVPNMPPGEQGSAIHLFHSQRFQLEDNDIADMRDGVYIQSSDHGTVRRTTVTRVRYGLHYMYADDNTFEDNRFEDSAAGAAIMYSRRLVFKRNRFVHNRGFSSVGLLLKDCDDLIAEDNLIADNARGLFLEGSSGNAFRRNVFAVSDSALVMFASSRRNVFERNAFLANLSPLDLAGGRTDTRFNGNYWSDADEPDLDGDGIRDRAYRIGNVFDHIRGNLTAADLLLRSPAARALAAAEQRFPLLAVSAAVDNRPLASMPNLPDVPASAPGQAEGQPAGVLMSAALLAFGVVVVRSGSRRESHGGRE